MPPILIFGIVICLAGGFIGWLGDRLGTYVGKKRRSFRGLRPKHTAMLATIVSGALIAFLTLVLLVFFSGEVKTALLVGPKIIKNNIQLRKRSKQLMVANQALERTLLQQQNQETAVQAQLSAAIADEQGVARKFLRSKRLLQSAQGLLNTSELAVSAKQVQLASARQQLAATVKDLQSTQAQRAQAELDVSTKRKDLLAADHDLSQARVGYSDALIEVEALSAEGKRLADHNRELSDANKSLTEANNDLSTRNDRLASEGPIFRSGQEIDRIQISTSETAPKIKVEVQQWLSDLSAKAADVGAGTGANGRSVLLEADLPPDAASPETTDDEADNIDALADSIADARSIVDSVVLIAEAHYNTLRGEQAKILVRPYANSLCFTEGQVIASCTIDGTQSPEEILTSLSQFLHNHVRPIAAAAGIIPFYNTTTGDREYGKLNDDGHVVDDIQRIGSGAVVTVVANENTYAIGPLHLKMIAAPSKIAHAHNPVVRSSNSPNAVNSPADPDGDSQ